MIIYFNNGSNPFAEEFKKSGHAIVTPYSEWLKVRIIRRLERFGFLRDYLYNTKEISPSEGEIIIIFDSNITYEFLKWIRMKYPHNRIVFWYWNPVNSPTTTIAPEDIPEGIEAWSYSPDDCNKYNLRYNTTFFFDSLVDRMDMKRERRPLQMTALFVGRDKGRLNDLLKIKKSIEDAGIICRFHIIGNSNDKSYPYEDQIKYEKVIEMIEKSDILIDYYSDDMAGLSLRPMEALFFGKKLITNNRTVSEYDFYNRTNIYILGDPMQNIRQFAGEEYVDVDDAIQERYLLSNWIERF